MKLSIGLPSAIPGVTGQLILDWARKADQGPFYSLCTLDRLTYPNFEPLITLTAAATVTTRIRLLTTILVLPLRNPVILAKQTASLDALSGGRLSLGVGVGGREWEFQAASVDFHQRGKLFEEYLETMVKVWSGQSLGDEIGPIGPEPAQVGGPQLLIGGITPTAIQRLGRWGQGYIDAASPVETARNTYSIAQTAWNEAGRPGRPLFITGAWWGLGPNSQEQGDAYFRDVYREWPDVAKFSSGILCATPETIKEAIKEREAIGVDEFFLMPTIADLNQLDRILEVIGAVV